LQLREPGSTPRPHGLRKLQTARVNSLIWAGCPLLSFTCPATPTAAHPYPMRRLRKSSASRRHLDPWNFSAQVPGVRADELKPEVIRRWLCEESPVIAAEARASKAGIWWLGDKAMQLSISAPPKAYAPKGGSPLVVRRQQCLKVQMNNPTERKSAANLARGQPVFQ
jgi:hypothetical protein